jgi:hypothetical protein
MATERSMRCTGDTSSRKPARAWARAALASACWFAWAGACGGKSDSVPVVGSESHFLMRCTDSCDSEGLACIGGICTQSCIVGEDSCSELASTAQCTDQSVEPGNVAVCDVSCTSRDDCAALGDGHECDGGFCRLGAAGDLPIGPYVCEDFRDQTPPPDVRGITIVNTGTTTLYLQPHHPMCSIQSSLVRVYGIAEPGATPRELHLTGFACAPKCGETMDIGWPYEGEGSLDNECPGATCIGPDPAVALEPGASLFEAARTESIPARLPRGCATGITTDAVNCYQRVLPPALAIDPGGGTYRLVVSASLTPECGAGCEPLVFQLEDPAYFYGNQVFEISADDPT